VWCGVIGGQLTGLYIFPQRLTGDIYASFLQMNCQHDGAFLQDELPA